MVSNPKTLNPFWLLGFTEGEGCFDIKISKSTTHKMKKQISLRFTLTQHSRDKLLMNNIKQYFGCGLIFESLEAVRFVINNFKDINKYIIPFFNNYPLQGSKRLDYNDFLKVTNLTLNKEHLTISGVEKIISIKEGMNKNRNKSKE
jgi:hypothetical protein